MSGASHLASPCFSVSPSVMLHRKLERLNLLSSLPSASEKCVTKALKLFAGSERVKTPETRPIEFCLAHKHLTQTRYIVRLFIGPKLPSLAGFSVFVATEYSLFNKNIFFLIHALCCKSQQHQILSWGKKYKYSYSYIPESLRAGWSLKGPSL